MKITKRQLKRIISEATMGFAGTGFGVMPEDKMNKSASFFGNGKVYEQNSPAAPGHSAMEDENLKRYQDGVYGGRHTDVETKLEDAILGALEMYQEVNGVSEEEAAQLVVDHVTEILGINR